MRILRSTFLALSAISCTWLAGSATADSISGSANIDGSVTVSANSIMFAPTFSTGGGMETGSFTGLTGGTIGSLSSPPFNLVGAVNDPGFIVFSSGLASPITFDLTFIAPGAGTNAACGSSAVGTLCTPTGSPFTLLQLTGNTVVVTLQLDGDAYTGTKAGGSTPTIGVFSTQSLIDGTIPQILQRLGSGGSEVGIAYSAGFIANSVPEPASMLLMGIGLMGVGLIARRKMVRS